jgi:hypothetical protein
MKLYADTPARRTRQVLADLFVASWTALWVWLAVTVNEQVNRLQAPGRTLESAGEGLAGSLTDAGSRAGDLPLVGDRLRQALQNAAGSGDRLADAGRAEQEAVSQLALLLAVLLVVVPVLLVLVVWLVARLRWSREATAAARLIAAGEMGSAEDLFALRALARQPLRRLRRIDVDPAAAWRRGDGEVIDALAALELRSLGVRAAGAR